jgi:hypothetical protein
VIFSQFFHSVFLLAPPFSKSDFVKCIACGSKKNA